jgi:hypothetical protein
MAPGDRDAVDRVFARVGKALAAYQRQIVARRAPFDVFVEGLREGDPVKLAALGSDAVRGLKLFVGRGNCHLCHGGPTFSDLEFHDIRLPLSGAGALEDLGRQGAWRALLGDPFGGTGVHSDDPEHGRDKTGHLVSNDEMYGAFKTQSLRNVAVTAPYMHRGHFASLEEVVQHYSEMKERPPRRTHHGDSNPETILVPLNLDEREAADLMAFLQSLTDTDLDPRLTRPPEGLEPPPAAPRSRSLADFEALSLESRTAMVIVELTGLDPVVEWRLFAEVEREVAALPVDDPSQGPHFLPGVERLAPREARELALRPRGRMFLPDLRELPAEVAAELASTPAGSELFLDSVAALEPEAADVLAAWPGDRLSLGTLTELDGNRAATLAGFRGSLALDGLLSLDAPVAEARATWHGAKPGQTLALDGLAKLDERTASTLAGMRGWGLSLSGLVTLAPEVARALRPLGASFLRLNGLTRLTPELVDEMVEWSVDFVDLRGVLEVDAALARRLEQARTVFTLGPPPTSQDTPDR